MKKKILLLSDHPLSTSGVGVQARYLIMGLIATGKYAFRCFGGAVRHETYETVTVNPDFIIKPTDGFGNREMLRHALVTEQPDAVMLFTDPRFFIWVWEMSDEIRQICPIIYNHLWDNPPWPAFNRSLYESTDLINCINHPTYEMVKEHFPEKTNYIPHAVPTELFFPIPKKDADDFKVKLLGPDRADHFIVLWVGRNARRKMPSDILISWKNFLDQLESKHGHRKATLVMHTEPTDPEGPNLHHIIDLLKIKRDVFFSKDRIGFNEMNILYNVSDCSVNRSCNEGFGLPTLESMQTGKPIIAIKTGGLTRQVVNYKTGAHNGIALDPDIKSMVGTQLVPYIYEDFISHEKLTNAFMQMYEMGPEKRAEIGLAAREYALEEYSMKNLIGEWDRTLTDITDKWKERPQLWSKVEL